MPRACLFPLRSALLLGVFLCCTLAAEEKVAPPFVSPLFTDNMVLQRGKPNTFWGWAAPGSKITVTIGEHSSSGVAAHDGRWQVQMQPPAAGASHEVTINGPQQVVLKNVAVGDVWLCGGQSNMEWGLPRSLNGETAVAAANHPDLRFFKVRPRSAYAAAATPAGTWKVCSPATVAEEGGLSAVAYYFARRVQAETGVPIGLIQNAMGGTPAETWMSPDTLRTMPEFAAAVAEVDRLRASRVPEYGNYVMHWYDEYDQGIRGTLWSDPMLEDGSWAAFPLQSAFEQLGLAEVPALVWFRKEIQLPDPLPAGDATLHLGVVEKMETSWVNGQWVGASSWVENPRAYRVPASALKPGRNLVAVRVLKVKSKNAFLSPPEKLRLSWTDGTEIPLAGEWKAAVSVDARPPHKLPMGYENYPIMPGVLYNGMLAPLAPFAVTGALWYQGEANAPRAYQYRTLLPAMIKDWRTLFGQGDFPFYIVSLPAFQTRRTQPGTDDWAEMREAQAFAATTVPKAGLAVTIDTGDAADIHPKDKLPVGERLARLALAKHYGRDVVHSGPSFREVKREGSALRIYFDDTHGGLQVRGEKLGEFSVCGADGVWHWADARIEGETVLVSSAAVPEPIHVRYAWQANPLATLFNGAGLPAAPFRTDDQPGVTRDRKSW